ncbi:MAG: hypothetical protein JXB36_07175 [Gammaproteobacteria bacterium]|nr:hypothetical protein [Gammaproteobacteria bacterium]
MRSRSHRSAVAAIVLSCAGAAALAQEDREGLFHWGHAAAFGSGVYALADETEAQVVRLPFAKTLREPGADRVGVRLLLPLTVGVQNLDEEQLEPGRPADEIEQAAFMPGVELELSPLERVTLRVRGQAGWGKELEGVEDRARLFSLGLRSRITWADAAGRPSLISGLQWAGSDPDEAERRALIRLTKAVEFDIPVPRWEFRDETMHLKPHVLGDWFYRPPSALAFGDADSGHVATDWQVGLAAGRETGFEVLGFRLDSIGIAYRSSDHRYGIRIYIGSVF